MTTTNVYSTARKFIVLSVAAMLAWVVVRAALGGVAQVPTMHTVYQGAPLTAPVAAPAPVVSEPSSNPANSAGTSSAPAGGATVHQAAQPVVPASSGSTSGCVLTGSSVPSKSFVRGGCPAQ